MILEHYPQPETGENWLIVRRIGATNAEVWRPVTQYRRGAEVLHLAPLDRANLERLARTGLRPKARARLSEWYALTGCGLLGRYASVTSNTHTTTREPRVALVLPHRELYEYAGEYYER